MDLAELQRRARRIRFVELELARRYPTDVIKSPMHLSLGQEWVSVAITAALFPQDKVIGSYRCHALYLAKCMADTVLGGDELPALRAMLRELYGLKSGVCGGNGGSMHLASRRYGVLGSTAIVATQIPVALGHAYALRGTDAVVVCFLGDGATEEGVFHESLNLARLHALPVLFVIENNELAVDTPIAQRAVAAPIRRFTGDFMPSWIFPGMRPRFDELVDPERVLQELYESVEGWRRHPRPWVIEVGVERRCAHVGPATDLKDGPEFDDVRGEVLAAFEQVERDAVGGSREGTS